MQVTRNVGVQDLKDISSQLSLTAKILLFLLLLPHFLNKLAFFFKGGSAPEDERNNTKETLV